MNAALPSIPAKRYFTIGEVADLCGVKTHVLRYWEQEFTQLRPVKRRGNRRYYQHHEVLMIRRIRDLLYEQGFTISGARNKLQELVHQERLPAASIEAEPVHVAEVRAVMMASPVASISASLDHVPSDLLEELKEIRSLLTI